jgi:hypothetical protein
MPTYKFTDWLLTGETYEYENLTYSQACIEFVKMLIDCGYVDVKKSEIEKSNFNNNKNKNQIIQCLENNGFELGSGAQGEKGWVKVISTDNNLYDFWFTINLKEKKIYIYKEYCCGGHIYDWVETIEDEWFEDVDLFEDEMNDIIDDYIN